MMKPEQFEGYSSPKIEALDVRVEEGFALTLGGEDSPGMSFTDNGGI